MAFQLQRVKDDPYDNGANKVYGCMAPPDEWEIWSQPLENNISSSHQQLKKPKLKNSPSIPFDHKPSFSAAHYDEEKQQGRWKIRRSIRIKNMYIKVSLLMWKSLKSMSSNNSTSIRHAFPIQRLKARLKANVMIDLHKQISNRITDFIMSNKQESSPRTT